MTIRCVWEHNGNDTLLYAENFPGAFTRGRSLQEAMAKMPDEIRQYQRWLGGEMQQEIEVLVVQDQACDLKVCDADSDVLFDSERSALSAEEYAALKALALKSAADFLALYQSVPNPDKSVLPQRETFYGPLPRTAREMYEHTKNVNAYYFGELDVDADNEDDILACRRRGFEKLESMSGVEKNEVICGSYGEQWCLRKVLRRFIWHDRIHAKAMWRMAVRTFGAQQIANSFFFE